jgi:hypothetical protein
MNKQQMEDRDQFRRYAEAALSGLISDRKDFEGDHYMARRSFEIAASMMLTEGQAFERYQLQALEAIVDNERIKHEGK